LNVISKKDIVAEEVASPKVERIDAHHHLWRYSPEEYGWIDETMAELRRDFFPQDLKAEMRLARIDGSIVVQARQALEETHWLLELAAENKMIRGVVGWAPIASPDFRAVLDRLSSETFLKGLRHVVQAEPDEDFILREDFNRGIQAIQASGLIYDILIYERHLPQTIEFVDRHPNQIFVLDHIAKPSIRESVLEPWATNIRELSRRENVYCKLSGLVTEADWKHWSPESLAPYLDRVTEAFGPQRLMAGSDWPVCLTACGYVQWFQVLEQYFSGFSQPEREAVLGTNAVQVYRL
jgi:L-fuconolactonase